MPDARPTRTAISPWPLIATFSRDVLRIDNVRNGINYGSNKVRSPAPCRSGAHPRRQNLLAADDMPNGGIRMTYQ